jgi:4-amino-4-deoxy-L-arabinose transferase-like glycosyltransferase
MQAKRSQWLALAASLLLAHAGLLAWGDYVHSPAVDEVGHLPAGISHWQFGRFDLYRVNPPLIRMVAALPVFLSGPRTDWDRYSTSSDSRAEFSVGAAFIAANGRRSFWLFTVSRWTCIPLSLLGGYVCFCWARELHGALAGLFALTLWCFCPNILGHGQLVTPDVGATSFAVASCYVFWHWLKLPGWKMVLAAGVVLGLAQLSKSTCILLFALYPVLWVGWTLAGAHGPRRHGWLREAGQLMTMLVLAVGVLNAGYGFEGSFERLRKYRFVSKTLTGPATDDTVAGPFRGGNRFAESWLADLPVPLPSNYVRGIDVQKSDFEDIRRISYLRGQFQHPGWWYYYIYALLVKVPLGTWAILLLACLTVCYGRPPIRWRDELVLLAPVATILGFVSSETGFTSHLRYVLPIFPFTFIWASRVASGPALNNRLLASVAALGLVASVSSSLCVYPHSLSYFNELAGGPAEGPKHLLDSNTDWGQDLLYLKDWLDRHPEARPLRVDYFGLYDVQIADEDFLDAGTLDMSHPQAGWYALSVNALYGYRLGGRRHAEPSRYEHFQHLQPTAMAGYSIYI